MINGFVEETEELNDYEKDTLLPLMVKGLTPRIGSDKAITNKQMREGLKKLDHSVSDARVRKLINYIRMHRLVVNLVSSSRGYYRTNDLDELNNYVESLMQRASSIEEVAKSFRL